MPQSLFLSSDMKGPWLIYIAVITIISGLLFLSMREEQVMAEASYIQLPQPATRGSVSVEEAILKRRSRRTFKEKELSLQQVSQLLWAAQGVTGQAGGRALRSAPSAGALYPMEIYALTKDGVFHYLFEQNKLEVLAGRDVRTALSNAALGQDVIRQAPLDIVICAVFSRVTAKYGERGMRYAHIEAGHVAQNIHLEAVALGLDSVPVGAFNDKEAQKILSLPANHEPLYIIPVGYAE